MHQSVFSYKNQHDDDCGMSNHILHGMESRDQFMSHTPINIVGKTEKLMPKSKIANVPAIHHFPGLNSFAKNYYVFEK